MKLIVESDDVSAEIGLLCFFRERVNGVPTISIPYLQLQKLHEKQSEKNCLSSTDSVLIEFTAFNFGGFGGNDVAIVKYYHQN